MFIFHPHVMTENCWISEICPIERWRTFLAAFLKTNFINTYFTPGESKTCICIKLEFPSASTKKAWGRYLFRVWILQVRQKKKGWQITKTRKPYLTLTCQNPPPPFFGFVCFSFAAILGSSFPLLWGTESHSSPCNNYRNAMEKAVLSVGQKCHSAALKN